MECRPHCGACCMVISISSPIPGMPGGKPAGTRCIHLTDDMKCALFGKPERPEVCGKFQAEELFCGSNRTEAINIMAGLEGLLPGTFRQF
ncbi:MAG: YkgJ family cysteine cluster protein [Bacteroidales bacterium]|nr:YkgJ family cysteine cluster protein [Bacteroidales bacterium]